MHGNNGGRNTSWYVSNIFLLKMVNNLRAIRFITLRGFSIGCDLGNQNEAVFFSAEIMVLLGRD